MTDRSLYIVVSSDVTPEKRLCIRHPPPFKANITKGDYLIDGPEGFQLVSKLLSTCLLNLEACKDCRVFVASRDRINEVLLFGGDQRQFPFNVGSSLVRPYHIQAADRIILEKLAA